MRRNQCNHCVQGAGEKLDVSLDYVDPEIPPIAYMDGVDLVTEGVLTLNRVLQLLRRYVKMRLYPKNFSRSWISPMEAPWWPRYS